MACQLAEQGQRVGLLALLDTYPPVTSSSCRIPARGAKIRSLARKLDTHLANLRQLEAREKLGYVLTSWPTRLKKQNTTLSPRLQDLQKIGKPLPPVLQNIEEINFAAVKDYLPRSMQAM